MPGERSRIDFCVHAVERGLLGHDRLATYKQNQTAQYDQPYGPPQPNQLRQPFHVEVSYFRRLEIAPASAQY
jgi:hypothetical protein